MVPPFIHKLADVQTTAIGSDMQVWQFAVILKDAVIGSHCNINCHTSIENNVVVGDRVTTKSGVCLWDGIFIEDDVFVGPHVSFINDKYPKSKQYPESFQKIHVCKGASIGANASILGGTTIGAYAMIGAGSVVTKDVPPYTMVYGNHAKIMGIIPQSLEK